MVTLNVWEALMNEPATNTESCDECVVRLVREMVAFVSRTPHFEQTIVFWNGKLQFELVLTDAVTLHMIRMRAISQ